MATQPWSNDPPSIAERYEGASGTSDLTVGGGMIPKDSRTPVGDVILAAGMSDSRVGMALLRLHSEWTSSPKPNKAAPAAIEKLAEQIKEDDRRDEATAKREAARLRELESIPAESRTEDETTELRRIAGKGPHKPPGSPATRAHAIALSWYVNELRMLANRLKTKGEVIEQLTVWGAGKGIAPEFVTEGLHFWLHSTCPKCDGHGLRFAEHQAAKQCHDCNGTGHIHRTEAAGRVVAHIDYSLGMARSSIKRKLRGNA